MYLVQSLLYSMGTYSGGGSNKMTNVPEYPFSIALYESKNVFHIEFLNNIFMKTRTKLSLVDQPPGGTQK